MSASEPCVRANKGEIKYEGKSWGRGARGTKYVHTGGICLSRMVILVYPSTARLCAVERPKIPAPIMTIRASFFKALMDIVWSCFSPNRFKDEDEKTEGDF